MRSTVVNFKQIKDLRKTKTTKPLKEKMKESLMGLGIEILFKHKSLLRTLTKQEKQMKDALSLLIRNMQNQTLMRNFYIHETSNV